MLSGTDTIECRDGHCIDRGWREQRVSPHLDRNDSHPAIGIPWNRC